MISELYALDDCLVNNLIRNEVTFEILEKRAGVWSVITPLDRSHIVSESMELKQSICDDSELQIGGCIPSQLTLRVIDTGDLSGKRIAVKIRTTYYTDVFYPSTSVYPSAGLLPYRQPVQTDEYILFVGEIYSCTKTSNYRIRKLVAFDRLYRDDSMYCKNRIYKYLQEHETSTIYFSAFANWLRGRSVIDGLDATTCVNWSEKLDMIDDSFFDAADKRLTTLKVVKNLCEINGIFLIDDMPANATGLRVTPRVVELFKNTTTVYPIPTYSNDIRYDDFKVKDIRYVQFPYYNDKYFVYARKGDTEGYSKYYSDNLLMNSLRLGSEARTLVSNLTGGAADGIDRITGSVYAYRPFKVSIFNRWWVQCGDRVKLPVDDPDIAGGYIESIVLRRTIKGISGITVTIEAKGTEVLGKESDEELNG